MSSKIGGGVNPNIFRAYDIRGIYPQELNEKIAYFIGRAFVKFLNKQNPKIVVGRDGRLSSPQLFRALTKGLIDQGARVVDIGLSPTPMIYFAAAHFKFDGGINITASHNPPEFNGFKMVCEKAVPISEKTGLKEIKKLAMQRKSHKARKGKIVKKNIISDYLDFNLKDFKISNFKPFKLVIDTANAVPGILIPYLKQKLNSLKIYPLFQKLDGNFPNHPPNPFIKENLRYLQKAVLKKRADLGVAFDGDGDRIIFVDEMGRIIPGDFITVFIAELILKNHPGEKIFYDIRSSRIVKEVIQNLGGKVVTGRLGHSFIKERMRKENVFFAGEINGHYYLKGHYFCETPFFVLFKILDMMSKENKSISELIKPYKKYFHSGEINFRVKDKKGIIRELEKRFKRGKISHLDGLRIDFPSWWFNVRPSNTEDLLRLNFETKTKELMRKKKKELINIILNKI